MRVTVQPAPDSGVEKPKPTSDGMTRWNAWRGIEAVRAGIAQRADDVEELHHRTGPAVQQDQRPRVRFWRLDVQEVNRSGRRSGCGTAGSELSSASWARQSKPSRPIVGQLPAGSRRGRRAARVCPATARASASRPVGTSGRRGRRRNRDAERLEGQLCGHPRSCGNAAERSLPLENSPETRAVRNVRGRVSGNCENLDTRVTSGVGVKTEVPVVSCGTCSCPVGTC